VSPARDQEPSRFTLILQRLVEATPGARAGVLVDAWGETVDYAGELDPFDLKVTAAHWQILFRQFGAEGDLERLSGVRQLIVHSRFLSYLVRQVHPGYTLVVVLHPQAAFATSDRALREADVSLCAEAGWPAPAVRNRWFGVEVETDAADRMRPLRMRVAAEWHAIEVMGTMVGLHPHERGFRVRLPTGAEMLLVRERLGRWFADEHVARKEEPKS
jgi:hypothetical protein